MISPARMAVVLVLVGCGGAPETAPMASEPPASALVAPGPMLPSRDGPAPFAEALAALPSATAIHITQGWMGLSPTAPHLHAFDLTLASSEATAHIVCRAAGQEHPLPDVTIPRASLAPILAHLADAAVTSGPYVARIDHTDDYPSDTLAIDTPSGTVTFHTTSQGELGDPWQISVAGTDAVVASPIPGEAFRDLRTLLDAQRCNVWAQSAHR